MQYRVRQVLRFFKHPGEYTEVPAGSTVQGLSLVDVKEWRERKELKRCVRAHERIGRTCILFEWDGKFRIAVVGKDVETAEKQNEKRKPRWLRK